MYLRPHERICIVQQYKRDWDLDLLKDVLLLGVFCKAKTRTSLHDEGGFSVWLHLSSLGFTFEMCMCIYIQNFNKVV